MFLVSLALAPAIASAQPSLHDVTLDETTSRPEHPTPRWVAELEGRAGVPPCDDHRHWGRSRLDGGLASRRRPDDLPCRTVWENTVRFELGLVAGPLLERADGAFGGLYGQLGVRYHELLSVYWQLHLLGGGWDRGNGGASADVAAWNGVMLELSPHRAFAVSAGPSFDISAGCDVGVEQEDDGCWAAWSYGVASRLTVSLGQVDGTGISLVGDFHVSLIEPDPRAVALLGVGFRL